MEYGINIRFFAEFGIRKAAELAAKAPEVIRDFGSLIQCTHLQDNTGVDSHQLPMTGWIKWPETIQAFKDIGYDGVLSIEYACGAIAEQGAPLVEDFINLSFKAAQRVWTLGENRSQCESNQKRSSCI